MSMHIGLTAHGRIRQGYKMIRCIIVCTYENVNISLNLDVIEGWVKAAIRQSCGTSVLHTGRQRLGMLID
jgi:hypothetical protein